MIEHFLVGLALVLGLAGGYLIARSRLRGRRSERAQAVHQILLPFTGTAISRRAVDAALRLARAEEATLMPAYLARSRSSCRSSARYPPRRPRRCRCWRRSSSAPPPRASPSTPASSAAAPTAMPSPACSTARASTGSSSRRPRAPRGFSGDDLVWLLEKAPAEVLILRPGPEDRRYVTANGRGAASPA